MPEELPDGLTEGQLKFGYWFTANKIVIRGIAYAIGFGVVGLIFASVVYQALDWGLISGPKERAGILRLPLQKVEFAAFHERNVPKALIQVKAYSLASVDGKRDLIGVVDNPNTTWWAKVTYHFSSGSFASQPEQTFVLPKSSRKLISYAVTGASSESPTLVLDEVRFMRVAPHEVSNYENYAASRLRFTIGKVNEMVLPVGDKKFVKQAFTVKNDSAFSFWQVPLQIELMSGSELTAVQTVSLERVRSGEARNVEITWFQDIAAGSTVKVEPVVNILDQKTFIPSESL